MVLLSLTVASSCKPNPPAPGEEHNPPAKPDPREELVKSLKGANVDGYNFAMKEDSDQVVTSLTNGALRNPVKLTNNRLVLAYASIKDKKANSTKTLKAEIVRTDNAYKLVVTDVVANHVIADEAFAPRLCPGQPVFNNFNECIDDFNCKVRPALQCEANRTCRNILTELQCCMKDGTQIHALMIIRPTAIRCVAIFPFDIDTVLVSP